MSEHPPQQHNSDPVHLVAPEISGVDPTVIDVVAGDPPVPITVWRTARTATDAGRSINVRLAHRLVAAYSRPGEPVVDLTGDHALTAACLAGRRRHHPAWFTDPAALTIGPATPPVDTATAITGAGALPPELDTWLGDTWFGADVTDRDLPPAVEPAESRPDGPPVPTAAGLVVAGWPLDAADAANRVKLAWLLTACAGLLRPGGSLILVVAMPAGTMAAPEDFSPVAAAAAGVGLGYLQHIVAVTADTEGDAFVYHVTDEELLALAAGSSAGHRWAVPHLRVHADLLVFGRPPDRRRRTREGGGGRG